MELIDKDALVAEIEKRVNKYKQLMSAPGMSDLREEFQSKIDCLISLKGFINNTLGVKDVDLEKETKRWWKEHLHLNPENKLWMDAYQSITFAKHFFELGLKAQKGEDV